MNEGEKNNSKVKKYSNMDFPFSQCEVRPTDLPDNYMSFKTMDHSRNWSLE